MRCSLNVSTVGRCEQGQTMTEFTLDTLSVGAPFGVHAVHLRDDLDAGQILSHNRLQTPRVLHPRPNTSFLLQFLAGIGQTVASETRCAQEPTIRKKK